VQGRWYVLAAWLVALGVSAPFAPGLVTAARFSLEPVQGTPSYTARERIMEDFPFLTFQDSEAIIISCSKCSASSGGVFDSPLLAGSAGNFTHRIIAVFDEQMAELKKKHQALNITWLSAIGGKGSGGGFGPLAKLLPHNPFLSRDNRSTVLQITWDVTPKLQNTALGIFTELEKTISSLKEEATARDFGFNVALTGPLALFEATLKSTQQDLTTKDAMVLPVALLILGARVRSWRLTLLTLLNVVITIAVSFAVFLPLATYVVEISPLAPSVMVFLSIAFSIDYSLFLFTRWAEEVGRGKTALAALHPMMCHSGEVVCLSGSILILCYLAVLLFPGQGISSIGLGASVTIFFAMVANMTVSPSAIAAFPNFFASNRGSFWRCCRHGESRHQLFWFHWGSIVTSRFCVIVVPLLAYAVMIPLALQMLRYRENFDNALTFPWRGEAADAYKDLQRILPPGSLSPVFILQEGDVRSDEWFHESMQLAERLRQRTVGTKYELVAQDYLGIAVLPDPLNTSRWANLSWAPASGAVSAQELLAGTSPLCIVSAQICEAYRELWKQLCSEHNHTAIMRISPQFDPYGAEMMSFVAALRDELNSQESTQSDARSMVEDSFNFTASANGPFRISRQLLESGNAAGPALLFSPLVIIFDIMKVIYQRLPFILLAVFASCFLCVGVVFKAACVPIKLFLTVVIPLCMVYGVAILVYQDGVLDFIGWRAISGTNGLYWANPVFTTTILIGLALDYDIFLFARVVELRLSGYDNRAAVVGALTLTGPTITAAGLIMTAGFGGLLLTDVASNNQIGFLMAFAVLVDTFIIRTCLVPAILVLASGWNYWPRRLPPGHMGLEDLYKRLVQNGGGSTGDARQPSNVRSSSGTASLISDPAASSQ